MFIYRKAISRPPITGRHCAAYSHRVRPIRDRTDVSALQSRPCPARVCARTRACHVSGRQPERGKLVHGSLAIVIPDRSSGVNRQVERVSCESVPARNNHIARRTTKMKGAKDREKKRENGRTKSLLFSLRTFVTFARIPLFIYMLQVSSTRGGKNAHRSSASELSWKID